MQKSVSIDFIRAIAAAAGINENTAKVRAEYLIEEFTKQLKKEKRAEIRGFGVFKIVEGDRVCINPKTVIRVSESPIPTVRVNFTTSRILIQKLTAECIKKGLIKAV